MSGYRDSYIIHISLSPSFRLPLDDGRRIHMDWHHYCGPNFFHDRAMNRAHET